MFASNNGSLEIVRELIKNGADINAMARDKRRRNMEIQH